MGRAAALREDKAGCVGAGSEQGSHHSHQRRPGSGWLAIGLPSGRQGGRRKKERGERYMRDGGGGAEKERVRMERD